MTLRFVCVYTACICIISVNWPDRNLVFADIIQRWYFTFNYFAWDWAFAISDNACPLWLIHSIHSKSVLYYFKNTNRYKLFLQYRWGNPLANFNLLLQYFQTANLNQQRMKLQWEQCQCSHRVMPHLSAMTISTRNVVRNWKQPK